MFCEDKNLRHVGSSINYTGKNYGAHQNSYKHQGEERKVNMCCSTMDLLKIIVAKSAEADEIRRGLCQIWHENQNLRRQVLAATKIVPPCEVKEKELTYKHESILDGVKQENEVLVGKVEEHEMVIDEKSKRIDSLTNSIEALEKAIETSESKGSELGEKLANIERRNCTLQKDMKESMQNLKSELKDKDDMTLMLESVVKSKKDELQEKEKSEIETKNEIVSMRKKIEMLEKEIDAAGGACGCSNLKVKGLTSEKASMLSSSNENVKSVDADEFCKFGVETNVKNENKARVNTHKQLRDCNDHHIENSVNVINTSRESDMPKGGSVKTSIGKKNDMLAQKKPNSRHDVSRSCCGKSVSNVNEIDLLSSSPKRCKCCVEIDTETARGIDENDIVKVIENGIANSEYFEGECEMCFTRSGSKVLDKAEMWFEKENDAWCADGNGSFVVDGRRLRFYYAACHGRR